MTTRASNVKRRLTRAFREFRRWLALSFALAGLAAAVPSCDSSPPPSNAVRHPVLLVGLDGLEWNVVLPLLEAGRMPALAGLMGRGTFGTLEATKPTLSPIIWTSIATGVESRRHGILGFVHGEQKSRDERGNAARLYTSNDRRVKAFWNIATDAGRRVHTIGWWMTYPAEPIHGVMVAQVNTITPAIRQAGRGIWKGKLVAGLAHQVHPPEREAPLLELVPRVEADLSALTARIFGEFPSSAAPLPAKLLEQSLWAFRADALYHRVALDVLANDGAFDLFAVYFGGADVVGHRFWRHAHPELYRDPPDEEEVRMFGHVLAAYYVYLDELLGTLMAAAPKDTNVIVVSDHGMSPIRRALRFTTPALSGGHLSAPPAFLVAAGPDLRRDDAAIDALTRRDLPSLGSVLDVTPTVLAILGIPVARDMDGEAMTEWLAPELLERSPVRTVATHTAPDWFATRAKPALDSEGSGERLEQLGALGYLDE